ncbi:RDD family protein [Paenibacillus pinistramenti]|uniref:RDD family protein n=1 Tax=Paenibacillus pinistramenti TaxID=1768003 RepID=UPI0011097772|nr:RDD family protein [Paenibacillus pinistramenti]
MKEPAGFWIRFAASIVDSLLLWIGGMILSLIIYGEIGGSRSSVTDTLTFLYMLIVPVVWGGFTVGKRMLGIRIRRMNGGSPGILNMLLRTLAAGLVYTITFGIGIIVSAFMVGMREDKRAIHDFIAGTQVVYD